MSLMSNKKGHKIIMEWYHFLAYLRIPLKHVPVVIVNHHVTNKTKKDELLRER